MFEPILFEAIESEEKTSISTEKDNKLSKSTVDTTSFAITRRSQRTVTQDTHRSDVDMEYPEEETVITSTLTKSTIFISKLNIATKSIPSNSSIPLNLTSVDENTENATAPTTKKLMLYEQVTTDKQKKYGRARDESTTDNVILNFMGYNFDDTICRIVDDRVLCGYNSNSQLAPPMQTVEVGNGCRLRGDRIECGYVNPPFDGMRRPAVRPGGNRNLEPLYRNKPLTESAKKSPELTTSYSTTEPTTITIELATVTPTKVAPTTEATSIVITTLKAIVTSPRTSTTTSTSTTIGTTTKRTTIKTQEHCVEKDDRIVCYEVRN